MHLILRIVVLVILVAESASAAGGQQFVVAERYAVASGHGEATAIGLATLRRGGNVVDAAIATSLALGVAEPYGSGLGGKLVLLYYDAATQRAHCITALCTAPAELEPLEFIQLPRQQRRRGYLSVGVPGLVRGLGEAHRRWGKLPWRELPLPAAELAEQGVAVDEMMHQLWQPHESLLSQDAEAAEVYLVEGKAPPPGARMYNADLGATLRTLATEGPTAFYEGTIAAQIVATARAAGSALTVEDFRNYRADTSPPLAIDYRGHRIYSCPPPLTGGVTVLATLGALGEQGPLSLEDPVVWADRLCRTIHRVYPPVSRAIADVSDAQAAAANLLLPATAQVIAQQSTRLDPSSGRVRADEEATLDADAEALPTASTSHLVVVDRQGNMVSLTQSLSLHFGAGVVVPGTGILLNDSLSNFSTNNRAAANHVEPAKRARSTIAPILALRGGRPWLALGIPGGQRIPTTTIQLLSRLIDGKQTLAEAMNMPRFHLRRPLAADEPANVVDYEADHDEQWVEMLSRRGWTLESRPRDGRYFGGGNGAGYLPDGSIMAVADPRRTNRAGGE